MIWRAFKYILSGLVLLMAGLLTFMYFGKLDNAAMLGLIGFFVFLIAMLWVDVTRPNRAVGLAVIGIALGFVYFGVGVLTGSIIYPNECYGKGALFCELLNFLYGIGGRPAAAVPGFAIAIALLYGVYTSYKRTRSA